jgi:hypothetical protein
MKSQDKSKRKTNNLNTIYEEEYLAMTPKQDDLTEVLKAIETLN